MYVRTHIALIAILMLIAGCSDVANERNDNTPAPSSVHHAATQPAGNSGDTGGSNVTSREAARGANSPANASATTQPAAAGNEMLAPRSSFAGYGVESYRLVSEKDEIVSVLKNGMVVIVKRIPSPVVAVRGVALTGGVYEKKWLGGGLSHLLEHLVAGGSSERRTEEENKDLLQKIGNNSNAYTTEDHTSFFINTTPVHMEQAVDLVTGWMLGAKITPQEYKREYQVVQRELEMGKGQPDRQFYYLSAMNRYHVSPARVPVIGYQEVIQHLSRDDVYTYYQMAYQPNNMVFVVAGDLEPEAMLKAVQKNVAGAPPGRVFSHDIEAEPPVLTPRTMVCTFPKLGQARLMLGFPSVTSNSPDMYALDLLATVLGGGESAMMTEELRDKQQLVSGVDVSDDTPDYVTGTFAVEMMLDPDKVKPATAEVLKMLEAVKKDGVDADRLERAKMQMRAARIKKFQTAEDIAASLADDYRMTGDIHFSDTYVERCNKVTVEQIKAVAKKYLNTNRLITSAMFPSEWTGAKGLPKAEDLLRPHAPSAEPTTQPTIASAVQRVVLPNGTILLLKHIATSPTVVMNMYSLGGVTDEDAKTNGLGNLTMEMLMRGTKTRNADKIAEFFDSTGGEMETACGNNSWYWNATCMKGDFAKTMEVYADIVNNPAFDNAELAPFKKRVEAAIKGEDADWSKQAIRFFKEQFYGPMNSPYQFLPQGTEKNIDGFADAQLKERYNKILHARRVLAIYGDVDLEQAKQLATDLLGKTGGPNDNQPVGPAGVTNAKPPQLPDVPANVASINVDRVEVNKTEQEGIAAVVIGFKANTVVGEKDWYNWVMAKTLTGGYTYPTGYLFETLRGKGLVYVAESQNSAGRNNQLPGTFLVFAGCDPSKVNEVVELSLENIARLQGNEKDINMTWFGRAKELITVADAMEHETPGAQASTAAIDELFGLGYAWQDQFADKIRAVELPGVQALAKNRLRDCVVTISTPKPEDVTVKAGLRKYESFPTVDLTPRGVTHDAGGAPAK
ncbi:MAG TPA: pitrilysin family protein [Tepidisphaeraceae bacterium]|jgi:zinc protease|nr:pitrilysin family protein [Tepidisphaeraceae bacterium]